MRSHTQREVGDPTAPSSSLHWAAALFYFLTEKCLKCIKVGSGEMTEKLFSAEPSVCVALAMGVEVLLFSREAVSEEQVIAVPSPSCPRRPHVRALSR